jgi:hypothetical protein
VYGWHARRLLEGERGIEGWNCCEDRDLWYHLGP